MYIQLLKFYFSQMNLIIQPKGAIIANLNAFLMYLYSTDEPPPIIPKVAYRFGLKRNNNKNLRLGEWQWSWWPAKATFDLRDYGA